MAVVLRLSALVLLLGGCTWASSHSLPMVAGRNFVPSESVSQESKGPIDNGKLNDFNKLCSKFRGNLKHSLALLNETQQVNAKNAICRTVHKEIARFIFYFWRCVNKYVNMTSEYQNLQQLCYQLPKLKQSAGKTTINALEVPYPELSRERTIPQTLVKHTPSKPYKILEEMPKKYKIHKIPKNRTDSLERKQLTNETLNQTRFAYMEALFKRWVRSIPSRENISHWLRAQLFDNETVGNETVDATETKGKREEAFHIENFSQQTTTGTSTSHMAKDRNILNGIESTLPEILSEVLPKSSGIQSNRITLSMKSNSGVIPRLEPSPPPSNAVIKDGFREDERVSPQQNEIDVTGRTPLSALASLLAAKFSLRNSAVARDGDMANEMQSLFDTSRQPRNTFGSGGFEGVASEKLQRVIFLTETFLGNLRKEYDDIRETKSAAATGRQSNEKAEKNNMWLFYFKSDPVNEKMDAASNNVGAHDDDYDGGDETKNEDEANGEPLDGENDTNNADETDSADPDEKAAKYFQNFLDTISGNLEKIAANDVKKSYDNKLLSSKLLTASKLKMAKEKEVGDNDDKTLSSSVARESDGKEQPDDRNSEWKTLPEQSEEINLLKDEDERNKSPVLSGKLPLKPELQVEFQNPDEDVGTTPDDDVARSTGIHKRHLPSTPKEEVGDTLHTMNKYVEETDTSKEPAKEEELDSSAGSDEDFFNSLVESFSGGDYHTIEDNDNEKVVLEKKISERDIDTVSEHLR